MEIFVGAACAWIAVSVFVLALRRLRPAIERDLAHERWCASGPVLLGVSCPSPAAAVRLATALQEAVGRRSTVVNLLGRHPHAHYRIHVRIEIVRGHVVRLVADGARRLRAAEKPVPETRELLAGLASPRLRDTVRELWLYGELWETKHVGLDRARVAWRGHLGEAGELVLEEMIGRAAWVDRGPDRATRRAA